MASPNLRAVARAAGVSLGTASLALRDRPEINAKTRARVQGAAARLGYSVNPLVSELMGGLRRRRRVTMADIAVLAGVSRATVSLSLRDPSRGSPETSAKIAGAMKSLGYNRDPLHSALVESRRSRSPADRHTTIAYLTSYGQGHSEQQFVSHTQLHEGATRRAVELGFRLAHFSLTSAGMTARRLREILLVRNIHAVIVAPTTDRTRRLDFDLEPFSCVGVGLSVGWPPIERVSNDHFQSVILAFQECMELGYRRIGFIVSRAVSDRLGRRWHGGYLLAQQSLRPRDRIEPLMPDTVSEIGPHLNAWIKSEAPDVILYGDGEIGALLAKRVDPRIGLVDLHVRDERGAVTGIFQASTEIGARAVESVVSQLHHNLKGSLADANSHLVPGRWVQGATAPGRGQKRLALLN